MVNKDELLCKLALEGKECVLKGLKKRSDLNGHTATAVDWIEHSKRLKVRLRDGSEVAVKLENFQLENNFEVIYSHFKVCDQQGKCVEKSLSLAVPPFMIRDMDREKKTSLIYLNSCAQTKYMCEGNLVCSTKKTCIERAVLCSATPAFHPRNGDRPAMIVNLVPPIPICGKADCDNEATRQTESRIKSLSRGFKKLGINDGIRKGKMRVCRKCNKFSTERAQFKKCSGCEAAFYCSEKCQEEDWIKHEKICTL